MTEQLRVEKLKEILSDQAFVEKLLGMETAQEVQKALKDKGVEMTVEEIEEVQNQLLRMGEEADELKKDQLKNVAGGNPVAAAAGVVGAFVGVAALVINIVSITTRRRIRW